jgi:choline kinase
MQAVIMAAGTGSRLQQMTRDIPKALVQVAGRPLLAYALAFAKQVGCDPITVVSGAFADKVTAFLEAQHLDGLHWVHNPAYLKGNLYSLGAALEHIDGDFLLLNTDHIYRRTIALRIREQCKDLVAFCDSDRALGADDMKVLLDPSGRVARISKQLTEFDRGYVGCTFCSKARLDDYRAAFQRVAQEHGDAAVVEMVLAELAQGANPPIVGDISGLGWLEVDTQAERAHADQVVAQQTSEFATLEDR